jgi:6-pyruvoyltetrahydropterin/6-carboxytetrahydropterin synthase
MQMHKNVRVTKIFTIDMAHALFGYDGPCKNIHGHTYYLLVTLLGKPNSDISQSTQGMVLDFGYLKQLVNESIVNHFDHALVINENAPYANISSMSDEFEKVIQLPFQPTCENLLLHFVTLIQDKFSSQVQLISMRLDETPTSFAEWHLSDNE